MSAINSGGLSREALKAVIFDLDGTLIRSTIDFKEMNKAIAGTLLDHGLPEDILDPRGRVNESIVRAYSYFKAHNQAGWMGDLEKDLNRVSAEVEMLRVDQTKVVPGTFDTLAHLKAREMPTAILTRGSRSYTMRALRASGLEGMFQTVICRDDFPLTEAKPNPIALRRVFDLLAMNNRQCLFIGDHETDFQCAKGADAPFAAVLTGAHDRDVWGSLGPDMIMESIAELPDVLEGRK